MMVLFISTLQYTNCCSDEERSALLQIQHYFKSPYLLQVWVPQQNPDCCQWERVTCSDVTNRVAVLDLSFIITGYVGDWYLNASLFSSFHQLEVLYLAGNSITGCLENEGFDKLTNLSSLWYLDMTFNNLKGSFDALGLCKLVQLEYLYLEDNHMVGNLPWCLTNLTSLQMLDVFFNQFNGNISSSPLISMRSLQSLNIGRNHFYIPVSLEPFFHHSNLKILYAQFNKFYVQPETHTSTSSPRFQLEEVSLSGCADSSELTGFLYHQQALTSAYLPDLNLKGELPTWLLINNSAPEELDLRNNTLTGMLKFEYHHNLTLLDVSTNKFQGHIPTELGVRLPNLEFLNMSSNAIAGSIPSSFGDMKSLKILDLSNNHLSGNIPDHLTTGCFSLQYLLLSNNSLQGQIFPKFFNLTDLYRLELDNNNFTGRIPDSLSNCSLVDLSLSQNHLYGNIPGFLGNMSRLYHLMLANNHLQGHIPTEFCQLNFLVFLDLSENELSGSLPSCFSPLRIEQIHLSKNRLQGQLNDALRDTTALVILDMSYNNLHGSLPSWIHKLSSLSYLKLSHNELGPKLPSQLCLLERLQLLDLSHNRFSGQIPACLIITDSGSLYESDKGYAGPDQLGLINEKYLDFTTKTVSYSYQGRILSYMAGIDLSCNNLTGEIPPQMGDLKSSRALNLSHNKLTGLIPSTFSKLKQIESLDLSYNNLNGRIPPELVELNALAVFRVSHNELSGRVPDRTAQFITFGEESYEGNPLLCGQPLPKSCDANGRVILPPSSDDEKEESRFIDMDIFLISFAVAYVSAVLVVQLVLYINPYWRGRWFHLVETSYYYIVDHLP